ncbi:radical SAM protein [Candidatus Shapirobacteria bacterium]|nr:radical SAM protein [Candidatus Shapirobacteria bacterium]
MKHPFSIAISYPPLESSKGIPFLAQNRQFQWTNTGNVILPVIPAYGASALHQLGYKVYWDDAIAEKISYQKWLSRIIKWRPSLVAIESKTPTIKRHWAIIKDLKSAAAKDKKWKLKVVLFGDHVTAMPEESLKNSPVDYVITGGDYDFMLLNLVDHLVNSTKLEPGFYYRSNALKFKSTIINTGKFALKHHNLDTLPPINRELTNWKLYGNDNTNFKYHPGAYLMTGRDCWWGKCTFCSWISIFPGNNFRNFSVKHTVDEIEYMASLGIREIFDDAGTLPIGPWLRDFCNEMIKRGLHKKVVIGCNMRFGALNQEQYDLMGKAGFRFILYGLESSNQKTLDMIVKNTKVEDSRKTLIMAKKAGLEPHLTIMIGYPWETKEDAQNTLEEARSLFRDGLADSMQATIVVPYPGTPLFKQCQENNWLKTEDWDAYDMRHPIMKSPLSDSEQLELVQSLFHGILTPRFLIRKVLSIRSLDDIKHLFTYAIKYLKKLRDFPIASKPATH